MDQADQRVAPVAPLIVTATFGASDFHWLNALRRAHYPPERNVVPAHLTLFHHLPPSELDAIRRRMRAETRGAPAPRADLAGVRLLDRGVAFDVDAPALMDIRERLADALEPVLIPQDRAPWWPHVTIQNKVEPKAAHTLAQALRRDFRRRPLVIKGLALWAYQAAGWRALSDYSFG